MQWQQIYDPLGNLWLSGLVAFIPIGFFILALTVLRLKGMVATSITIVLTTLVALFAYKMPFSMIAASAVYGFFYGLWPIAWIVIGAIFLYKISIKTGQFDIIRASIISITPDQRLQMILVAGAFGTFLEGAAGFGAPVAITAALLVGLGFKPLHAAGIGLIANAIPSAFGAIGIPITVAAQVSGLEELYVSKMTGRQLPLIVPVILFWLVAIIDGWRGIKETYPAVLVAGLSIAIVQAAVANTIGPALADIISAIVCLVILALFLKYWRPKHIFRFEGQELSEDTGSTFTVKQLVKAWSPFMVLTFMVLLWSSGPFKALFKAGAPLHNWVIQIPVPFLHNMVQKVPPVTAEISDYAAMYKFDWFSATGTAVFISCIVTLLLLKMKPSHALKTFKETLNELKNPILSIGLVLAFAYMVNYSGMSSTLALMLAQTGKVFVFFSPFLGWFGVFLTGSAVSTNALFASSQAITAAQIGIPEVLLVASNTFGSAPGKMISLQSIVIACAAVGLVGKESDLFRFTVKHSAVFVVIVGIIVSLQAYVFPFIIP